MTFICLSTQKHLTADQIKTVLRFWFKAVRYNAPMTSIKVMLRVMSFYAIVLEHYLNK